jgi:predicted transcriptional regulator
LFRLKNGKRHRAFNLGPLEWQAMEIVWQSETCSVNDVVDRLPQARRYTTVMTTLSRLFQKGLLSRTLSHRRFLYSARVSRQDLERASADYLLSRLLSIQSGSTAPDVMMCYLLENLSRHDTERFNQAVETVRTKR